VRPAASALAFGTNRLIAFWAKLRALRARSAAGTERGGLGGETNAVREILLLNFLPDLFHSRLRLRGRQLGFDVGRAIEAEAALLVPTGRDADPVRALHALAKVGLCLVDGLLKGAVVRDRRKTRTENLYL
jgi:hypothetical protein